ncbi:MAG: efflux RND transporter permease subunit [Balneolales bacterium]
MRLYELAVERPVAIGMVFFAVIVFGFFSFSRLPIDLFPEIEPPVLTIITTYQGVSALEMEQNVTEPLEDALSTIPNMDEMYSESLDNTSTITLEFDWGIDMVEISNDVRDAISRSREALPEGIDEPLIQKFDAGAIPVIILSATADESFGDLEDILDDQLVGPLNRVSGVGAVNISGAPIREVQVLFDPLRMNAYNLDIEQVAQIIGAENIITPAGRVDLGDMSYNLRTNSEFQHEDEIGDVVVSSEDGQTVYLRDVARVESAFEEETSITRVNGERGVTVTVNKQSDANTVSVASNILDRLPSIENNLPADVTIGVVLDTSEFITSSINNLSSVLFFAIVFVILVVLFFLHQWRATFIVAVTIPVSLIVAFIYLALSGGTLNIISLSSLAIALGMVVDDAIVVLENVMKRIEKGDPPKEAAVRGSKEVFTAVIASTLTVVAVFLPLTFITGMMGIWFQELGFIVVVTMVTSTLSALMLTPMLASVMLGHVEKRKKPGLMMSWVMRTFDSSFSAIENQYGAAIRWSLNRRKTTVGGAFALFVSSLMLMPLIGTEFMPVSDNSRLQINAELATGRSLDFTSDVTTQIEGIIEEEIPEIRSMSISAGGSGWGGATSSHIINASIQVVDLGERERSIFEMAEILRDRLDDLPEVVTYQVEAGGGGAGGARPVEIQIVGPDLEETTIISDELISRMEDIQGIRDVAASRGDARPEFELILDRDKLAASGLNSSTVSNVVRGKMDGLISTQYRSEGDEYDVVLSYEEESKHSLASIENIRVNTPSGLQVRVASLGEIQEVMTPPNIERLDRERVITVSSGLVGRALGDVVTDIQGEIAGMEIPANVDIIYGGDIEEQQETFSDMLLILILSLMLVYIVMAGQFESFKDPLVIMFSIPFAFTGVLLALLITNTPLGVIGMLGAVILVGIVVKNGIVLIDYIRLLQSQGMGIIESIVEAGILRLRPVLMTTLTTILAMMPLAIAAGEGAETWQPMAITVIGGLAFSTVITLGLIPVMYAIFNRKRIKAESA